jgi:hypothetical protein
MKPEIILLALYVMLVGRVSFVSRKLFNSVVYFTLMSVCRVYRKLMRVTSDVYILQRLYHPKKSSTDYNKPHGRILGFLDRSRYYFFQVAPQLYSRG